ncbi:MAG: HD domain-containing protein [Salinivirgaceae bacterium]
MESELVIERTIAFVKQQLIEAEGGHDWWHIYRVWSNVKVIATVEGGNLLIIELAALLHDIADAKFHQGDEGIGPKIASEFLKSLELDEKLINQVVYIIAHMSFKGGQEQPENKSLEFQIVQDADRLDAMGAIGIARTFNYGGYKNREIYNPEIPPNLNQSKEAYKNSKAPTINHFYEKLLLLKDLMNTQTGKKMAAQRHQFMELYLEQFFAEWNCTLTLRGV